MRALTEAEARVLAVLLGESYASEKDRLHRAQVPRSTYHAARRRAYAEGWLSDRYVPGPTAFGYRTVTVALSRPFADRSAALAEAWGADPGCVLLWSGPQLSLAVFFHRDGESSRSVERAASGAAPPESSCVVRPEVDALEFPVYFDFEGIWGHIAGQAGTSAYPQGLPVRPPGPAGRSLRWSPRSLWAARELLARPFGAEAAARPGHLVGPFGLPLAQKALLTDGRILHRVLANPGMVPPFHGRSMARITFLAGQLRDGVTPEMLFVTLTKDCRVNPFLFAAEGRRLLIGAIGGAAPEEAAAEPRRPVLPTMRQALEGIQVYDESTAQIRALVDHRYDRLSPASASE